MYKGCNTNRYIHAVCETQRLGKRYRYIELGLDQGSKGGHTGYLTMNLD